MDGHLRTCWRCGVDFDPALYIGDAPCPDCQEDVPGEWLMIKHSPGRITKEETEHRLARVKELHQAGLLDSEIGERMGLSRAAVCRWRKRLKLPPHRRPEKHMWKDVEAHMQHAAGMVNSRKAPGRGKQIDNFKGSRKR